MRLTSRWTLISVLFIAIMVAAGCGDDDEGASIGTTTYNPYAGYSSERYSADSMWLCRPGLAHDYCYDNIDATAVLTDSSLQFVPHVPATDPKFDCFYVYPTVNLSQAPGNDTNFSDVSLKLDPLLSQAAPFTGLCRVFAPLYRQVTIGTIENPSPSAQQYLDIAYGDVLDAFKHYMGQFNDGRPFVLMGHSQGAMMLTRLLREQFDDTRLRGRFVSALLIGDTPGELYVPPGKAIGGTFQNIPLCTSDAQTDCVIGYNSFSEESPPPPNGGIAGGVPAGMQTACTNPAALGGGKARFAGSYFPNHSFQLVFQINVGPPGIDTPFTLYRDYFTGECVTRADGVTYLAIGTQTDPGDQRMPNDIRNPVVENLGFGLHLLDYNLPLQDLLSLVAKQADTYRSSR